jgi:hypothetical protein
MAERTEAQKRVLEEAQKKAAEATERAKKRRGEIVEVDKEKRDKYIC